MFHAVTWGSQQQKSQTFFNHQETEVFRKKIFHVAIRDSHYANLKTLILTLNKESLNHFHN